MDFDEKAPGNKKDRDRTLIRLIKSPAIMASGIPTIFLSEKPNELYDKLNLLLQEKQAGNKSNTIDEEIVATVDRFIDYKSIYTIQHNLLLFKCLN